MAEEKLRKALEAITGWKMTAKAGIPNKALDLAANYEDALGEGREAFIAATRDWVLRRMLPPNHSQQKRSRFRARKER